MYRYSILYILINNYCCVNYNQLGYIELGVETEHWLSFVISE